MKTLIEKICDEYDFTLYKTVDIGLDSGVTIRKWKLNFNEEFEIRLSEMHNGDMPLKVINDELRCRIYSIYGDDELDMFRFKDEHKLFTFIEFLDK